MRLEDAAVIIGAESRLSIEEIEAVIRRVVEADRASRQCCEFAQSIEKRFWSEMCVEKGYYLAMISQHCKEKGDLFGAEKWITVASVVENLPKDRARSIYARS